MQTSSSKMAFACAIAALALSASADANAKKRVVAAAAAMSAAPPRPPGYALIELENGKKDRLRVAEGEARATISNIMANDVDFITVIGGHTIVTVYQDANFRGHSLTLRCGNYELLQEPRNDIESIRVTASKKPVSECQGSEREIVQIKTWDK
jgi:hypothetical protein